MKKKILIVVGTRPNFIKITQFKKIASAFKTLEIKVVHTGQHYDEKMADIFFKQFEMTPDFFLNVPSLSVPLQMAHIMIELEKLMKETYTPDLLLVVGDVNSTFAGALTANKMNLPVAHIESGLRSFDKTMPEEHNRVLTDAISDYFFITEQSGYDNLLKENKSPDTLFFVGNTMIDTIVAYREEIRQSSILEKLSLKTGQFVLMTMHRPATVDNMDGLKKLISLINKVSEKFKIVLPLHPRTRNKMEAMQLFQLINNNERLIITEPLDYFSFHKLIENSKFILTDSGGIQEESTFYKIPCLTFRPNTERPVTVTSGTNTLIPFDMNVVDDFVKKIEEGNYKTGHIPDKWDGQSTKRIIEKIAELV